MAGESVVHIGENSPEHVALELLRVIQAVEGKGISHGYSDSADRKWILDTYAECLLAVRNPSARIKGSR